MTRYNGILRAGALIACLSAVNASGQDPFKVAPDAYKLQFENEWVKVARVHYGPRAKIQPHDHPTAGTVFVYLNNGGQVRFSHVQAGEASFPLIRPATTAGAFRLARAVTEQHEVENLSELPNDFLRVELRTDPVDAKTFQGRFPPDTPASDKSAQKVAFENGQVRIVRITCAPGEDCDLTGAPTLPALLITLTPAQVVIKKKGSPIANSAMAVGQTQWLNAGEKATLHNGTNDALRQLRIEFKTSPAKGDDGARDE
jgi:hypothetical protein